MAAEFTNASPKVILRGAQDLSGRILAPNRDPLPQHLPLFYIKAEKGTDRRVVTSLGKLAALYGSRTLDPKDKFYNHQTEFLSLVAGNGNTVMVQRMVPDDAKKSNVVVYLDILEDEVPNYVRNSDGSLVVNESGTAYVIDEKRPTVPGYRIKWIREVLPTLEGRLGSLTAKTGTMSKKVIERVEVPGVVDDDGSIGPVTYRDQEVIVRSHMYPIFEARAAYPGEAYNNIGFTINNLNKDELDTKIASELKSLPYALSLVGRKTKKDAPKIQRTLFGESRVNFVFKADAVNPRTEAVIDFETIFEQNWFNETNPNRKLVYHDYEGLYFYRDNYERILDKLIVTESRFVTSDNTAWNDKEEANTLLWYDFTTDDQDGLAAEAGLLNPFSCRTSKGVRYFSIAYDNTMPNLEANQTEINLSSNTPVFLGGGSDGTLDNEEYEKQVVRRMDEYLDNDSEVHDLAVNVESIFYDSGFTLATKLELTSFIALRKDTFLVLSTHDATLGRHYLPLSDQRAIAVALRTRLNLVPESEYYGTKVARGIVMVGTYKPNTRVTNVRVPLTYELADKASKMMGSADGIWKSKELFDIAPGNIIRLGTDIQPEFITEGIKPTLWEDGIVWAQPFDRDSYYFPALQTVYDDDTSVLNSFFTAMALCTLEKIGAESHRNFTGSVKMTDGQFKSAVTSFLNSRTTGIFADMFVIINEVTIDEADELRGYSWHAVSKIYANNMKTVCVYNPAAYRMSDLNNEN